MQTEHLSITGMTCGGCTTKITRALKAIPGVGEVTVSLSLGDATIQYDEKQTSIEQLKLAINTAGYGVSKGEIVKNREAKVVVVVNPQYEKIAICFLHSI